MAKVYVHPDEGLENALKRFKKYVKKDGTVAEYEKKTAFMPKRKRRKNIRKKGKTA